MSNMSAVGLDVQKAEFLPGFISVLWKPSTGEIWAKPCAQELIHAWQAFMDKRTWENITLGIFPSTESAEGFISFLVSGRGGMVGDLTQVNARN